VDDNEAGRYAIAKLLRQAGHTVVEAASARACFDALSERAIDLVLLDVKLPDISGLEVCRRLKTDPATAIIPVIQMSALLTRAEDRIAGLESGADAWLATPADPGELQAYITGLLRSRRAEESLRESRERLRLAATAARLFAFEWDVKTDRVRREGDAPSILGVPFQEETSASFFSRVHPEDRDRFAQLVRSLKPGADVYTTTYRVLRPDGAESVLEESGRALFDARGEFVRLVGMVADITRRRRAEEGLEQSEALYRATFDNAAVGIAHVALDGRWLRFNQALCDFTGFSPGELRQKTFGDITHPDDLDKDWAQARRLLAGEISTYSIEKRYLRKNGEPVWAWLTVSLLRDPDGRPRHFISVIQDIAERKRAEALLQRSRDRLDLLSRTVSTLLAAADPQTVIEALCDEVRVFLDCAVFFNYLLDPAGRRLRLNACGGVAPRLARKVEPLELDASLCGMAARESRRLVAENLATETDPRSRLVRSLGVRAYACHPLLGARGRVFGTLSFGATNRDRFAGEDLDLMKAVAGHVAVALLRRRAQQALQESEERFRVMADGAPIIIWVTDPRGDIRFLNRAYCEFFGVTQEEVMTRGWQPLVHPDDAEAYTSRFFEAIEKRQSYRAQARVRRRDGAWRWIESCAEPLFTRTGEFSGMAGNSPDITERKDFEAELQRLVTERTAKLHELVGELEHLSYTITHDMRAPLRAMRGFADAIGEICSARPEPELDALVQLIGRGAERMDLLITDALQYTKAVRQELPLAPVDLGALLRGMLDTYPQFISADIRLDEPIPSVLGNEAALTQCFSNLLGNAVKFVRPGEKPRVRVWSEPVGAAPPAETAGAAPEWIRVWVEDQGIGISKTMLPKLFQMFSRGSRDYEGTGIGLALVRKVVQRMGGRVGVESEEGKGSRFWVELRPGW
jgi:PAS domain S-box-containing protein